ncbi:DUF6816 family protein [Acaryochloris thomasi]|nr:hypothetical protein [Acaryochloris thomasi]
MYKTSVYKWADIKGGVLAGPLADRLDQFPSWKSRPPLKPAQGNLQYPDWFQGEWQVTSTLTALEAPLSPEIVTPGFADQERYLEQPVVFDVRFGSEDTSDAAIVADQAYNSRSLITAYLGDGSVQNVTVDPKDPTRQVTRLRGDRKLTSVISDRATESSTAEFITSELFQQIFSSASQIYVNQVENTTDYRLTSIEKPQIEADQVTAIYLSPQDPQYFKAGNRPVALYRYHLILTLNEHLVD